LPSLVHAMCSTPRPRSYPRLPLVAFLVSPADPRDLDSFPTRRSSDLENQTTATQQDVDPSFSIEVKSSDSSLTVQQVMGMITARSEEHTSELQSRFDLVCRLLLEKKKKSAGH